MDYAVFEEISPEHISQEEFDSIDKTKLEITQSPNDNRYHIYSNDMDRYVYQTFTTEDEAIEFINDSLSVDTEWDPKNLTI